MQNYRNFTVYQPENVPVEVLELPDGRPGVITWLHDDEGNDWYDIQQNFADDTLKVLYGDNGVICGFSMDVTELNPVNMSVAEVDVSKIPADAVNTLADGVWCYAEGEITPRIYSPSELRQQVQTKQAALLDEAWKMIFPLSLAVKYGEATASETASLEAWERYYVRLNRVNTDKPEWPESPV